MFSTKFSPLLARSSVILKRLTGGSQSVKGREAASSVVASVFTGSASSSTTSSFTACHHHRRWYITRAHPVPTPVVALPQALDETLDGVGIRRRRRERKYKKRNHLANKEKSSTTTATTAVTELVSHSHPDETIDLALNLNLDPRKPGQSLRGSISLPNGTGKKLKCLVFTKDIATQKKALAMGAHHAGGEALVNAILQRSSGTGTGAATTDDVVLSSSIDAVVDEQEVKPDTVISIDSLDRVLASQEMIPIISKTLARILGPRGLMPNVKTGTVFTTNETLLESLSTQIAGKDVVYRTERAGVIHIPIGKYSFGINKLLENIGQVMVEIYKVKPEQYGKPQKTKKKNPSSSASSKASKHAKYLLSAYISATQGKSIKLDLRTLDPNSSFFLRAVEAPGAAAAAVKKEQQQQQQQFAEATPESSSSSTAVMNEAEQGIKL